jgi:hypothetical protein
LSTKHWSRRKESIKQANEVLRKHGRPVFAGDSVDFLASIYKDTALPLNIRMAAAAAAGPFERPRMNDNRVLILEQREAEERNDQERRGLIAAGDARIQGLIEQFHAFTADRDAELTQLLADGEITSHALAVVRSWTLPPELPALPPPDDDAGDGNRRADFDSENLTPENGDPQTAAISNGDSSRTHPPDQPPALGRFVFGSPHQNFWLGARAFASDEFGEIDVGDATPEDIAQLERHGYRPRR